MSQNPFMPPREESFVFDQELILAERGTRLGAAILDNLLLGLAALPGVALMLMIGDEDAAVIAGGLLMIAGILAVAIYQWYLVATTGQSIAKGLLGIKIVKIDGSPVDFVSGVILRSWVIGALANLPYVGGLIGLIDALMIFGEERRCLHDQIAGTKVVIA